MNPFKRSSATVEEQPVESNIGEVHEAPMRDLRPLQPGEWQREKPLSASEYLGAILPTSSASREAPSVPFLKQEPQREGLYWWRSPDFRDHGEHLCVVLEFGGNLCVRIKKGDSSAYINCSALHREWAGPLPIGDGMSIRNLMID